MGRIGMAVALVLGLSVCGAETASTAATAAVAKKKDVEAGRNTVQKAQEQAAQAVEQMQQRDQDAESK